MYYTPIVSGPEPLSVSIPVTLRPEAQDFPGIRLRSSPAQDSGLMVIRLRNSPDAPDKADTQSQNNNSLCRKRQKERIIVSS